MIKLVRIDPEYIKQLREVDQNVQINSVEMNKQSKPFLGILFIVGWIEYFVPLSSPKEKHNRMRNSIDFHKIYGENGRLRAVLNFNNMVPVVPSLYQEIDISKDKDRYVLVEEYRYCKNKEGLLKKNAELYYQKYCKNQLTPAQMARTCNFIELETVLFNKIKSNQTEMANDSNKSK